MKCQLDLIKYIEVKNVNLNYHVAILYFSNDSRLKYTIGMLEAHVTFKIFVE
jgi:hypothetical protein